MYYIIDDKLEESTYEECLKRDHIYVAIVDKEEFKRNSELFNMGIDMEFDPSMAPVSCVKVNYDSLPAVFPYRTGRVFPRKIMNFRLFLMNRVLFL